MGESKLVRVERFEELATGMRVAVFCRWCGRSEFGVVGDRKFCTAHGVGVSSIETVAFSFIGSTCGRSGISGRGAVVTPRSVREGRVFRFAADLGISDQLATEDNPYTSRSAVGTDGRDEVIVARKERAR